MPAGARSSGCQEECLMSQKEYLGVIGPEVGESIPKKGTSDSIAL